MQGQRQALLDEILPLPVWDTHTHLQGAALAARSLWDIGHYFWYLRELLAAGYLAGYRSLPEDERIAVYVRAYHATRTTSMHWVVRQIFRELYGLEITDEASVRAAAEAVRAAAARADWPQQVCRRAAIRRIVVNTAEDVEFAGLPATSCYVPRVEERLNVWLARLAAADTAMPGASAARWPRRSRPSWRATRPRAAAASSPRSSRSTRWIG